MLKNYCKMNMHELLLTRETMKTLPKSQRYFSWFFWTLIQVPLSKTLLVMVLFLFHTKRAIFCIYVCIWKLLHNSKMWNSCGQVWSKCDHLRARVVWQTPASVWCLFMSLLLDIWSGSLQMACESSSGRCSVTAFYPQQNFFQNRNRLLLLINEQTLHIWNCLPLFQWSLHYVYQR